MLNNFLRIIKSGISLLNMKEFKTIGTHDGVFHCDEVLGCAMLKIIYPNAKIIRSRNDEKLAECDIVIDVGGLYDSDNYRFDHHQRDFQHSISTILPGKPWKVKLSSAGLVYCHFGKDILRSLQQNIKDVDLEKIYDKVYESFIQEIDAIDNGIPICDGEMAYYITTHLSARVKRLNKRWNQIDFIEEEAFNQALTLVSNEFKERVQFLINDWLPGRDIVLSSMQNRFNIHESGEIMQLSQSCPWKSHFFELEKELKIEKQIKFVLFIDKIWRVQAVSIDENSFLLRIPLYAQWQGLRDDELQKVSGINGAVFVHSNGFIGGNKTKEGALEMAVRTISLTNVQPK